MASFNVQSSHPLIPNSDSYIYERKLLTVHSDDRDIAQWPSASSFSIILPESMKNVQSMSLTMIDVPNSLFNISELNENNKIKFTFKSPEIPIVVTLADGHYSRESLLTRIVAQLIHKYTAGQLLSKSFYDKVEGKFTFIFNKEFTITPLSDDFKYNAVCREKNRHAIDVDTSVPGESSVIKNYADWGLGYSLGINKTDSNEEFITSTIVEADTFINGITETGVSQSDLVGTYYILTPSNRANITNPQVVYMEVDKYNSICELYPYPNTKLVSTGIPDQEQSRMFVHPPVLKTEEIASDANVPRREQVSRALKATTSRLAPRLNNTPQLALPPKNIQSGQPNAAFAKIPIIDQKSDNRLKFITGDSISSGTVFASPVERIQKLHFRFRTHNGRPVDFNGDAFNFTIEFGCLVPKQKTGAFVLVPPM